MIYVKAFFLTALISSLTKYIDSEDAVVRELLNQLNEVAILE